MKLVKLFLSAIALLLPLPALALNVFACEPEWAALTEALAGDHATVYTAIDAGQDAHHVQARPGLISRMRKADLVVCTGADLEIGWLPVLLSKSGNRLVKKAPGLFYATEQVELIQVPDRLDRADGDIHPDGNPHAFMDPARLQKIAKALSQRLAELDSEHADDYQMRWQDFKQRWEAARDRWQEQATPLQGVKVAVHHDEWVYLLDWLGMEQEGELEPKPGLPPTPSHLGKLHKRIDSQDVALILRAPHNNADGSRWLAKQTSARAVQLPYTVGGGEGADDLFGLFDSTVATLLDAVE